MEPNYTITATGPADYGFAITPSDSVDLPRVTRAIFAAGGGTVAWHNMAGALQTTTFIDGDRIAIKARRVLATGTTATGIEGLA